MAANGSAAEVTESHPSIAGEQASNDEPPEWKSYVERRQDVAPDFPTISKFQKDDVVWIVKPSERGVTGPCTVVQVLGGETYRVRNSGTGNESTELGEHLKYRI